MTDEAFLTSLLGIVETEMASVTCFCSKVARLISERSPQSVYDYFDRIAQWLNCSNSLPVAEKLLRELLRIFSAATTNLVCISGRASREIDT